MFFNWSTLGFFTKILCAKGVSFELLLAVRASLGWVAMLLFMLLTQVVGSLRVVHRTSCFLHLWGSGVRAFYLLYFYTVHERTPGRRRSCSTIASLRSTLCVDILKESLRITSLLALVPTFLGILLVVGACNLFALEVTPFVLLSSLLCGLRSIFGKPSSGHLSPTTIVSYALGIGAVLLVLAALPSLHTLVGLSLYSYVLLVALAVVHTALAFGLYTAGLKCLEARQATLEPVAASTIGSPCLGRNFSRL
ncbi:MAG: DMT family transporter [Actinomycetota bacterium]|nr:DMT family transporter [Actinomycetota bacterium]